MVPSVKCEGAGDGETLTFGSYVIGVTRCLLQSRLNCHKTTERLPLDMIRSYGFTMEIRHCIETEIGFLDTSFTNNCFNTFVRFFFFQVQVRQK